MANDFDELKEMFTAPLKEGAGEQQKEPVSTETPEKTTPTATEQVIKNDPPVKAEETPATPSSTEDDIAEELQLKAINKMFGTNFETLDQASVLKNAANEYPSLQEYKTKYEEISKTPIAKFANDSIKELNDYAEAAGITDTTLVRQIKRFEAAAEKDPIEALVLSEIIKDPSKADNKDILRKMIQRKYRTEVDPDLEGEELARAQEDADIEKFRLQSDSSYAIKEINTVIDKVKNHKSGPTVSETQEQSNLLRAQFEDVIVKNQTQIFGKIKIEVPSGKDGSPLLVDEIELTPQEQSEAASEVIDTLVKSKKELTQENVVNAITAMYDKIKLKNFDRIVGKSMMLKEAEVKLAKEKEIHNPSSPKIETPANQKVEKDASAIIQEKFEQQWNGG